MAKNKNKKKKEELDPIKQITEISNEAQKELMKICNELLGIAKDVKEEYGDELDIDTLNELSGSITQIHEDSPFLDEIFEGETWKKVIKTGMPVPPLKDGLVGKDDEKKDDKNGKK